MRLFVTAGGGAWVYRGETIGGDLDLQFFCVVFSPETAGLVACYICFKTVGAARLQAVAADLARPTLVASS